MPGNPPDMHNFLNFFYDERGGIFVLLLCIAFAAGLIRYLASMFGLGRFAAKATTTSVGAQLANVLATLVTNLIDDFRHLLALILVLIFASVLASAIWRTQGNTADMTAAIQTIVATLGGLIGSIIGYYFGESAQKRSRPGPGPANEPTPAGPVVQKSASAAKVAADPTIEKAPEPRPAEAETPPPATGT